MCMRALYSTISSYNLLLRVTEGFVLLEGGNVGEKTFVYVGEKTFLERLTELQFYFF